MTRPFALKNGAYFILTEAPGGIYNAEQLRTIASLCEQESAIVKATEDQRIGMFISPGGMGDITAALQKVGLSVRHYQNGLHGAVACLGEVCPKEEQDALGLAMELQDSFNEMDGKSANSCVKVGINGCGSCCVPSHTLDLALIGEENGYRISLGGKNSQLPELASYAAEGIPPDQVAPMVRELIKIYQANKEGDETFGEHIERAGVTLYLEALKPYSADALGEDMPFDLGSHVTSTSQKVDTDSDQSALENKSFENSDELNLEEFMQEPDELEADSANNEFTSANEDSEILDSPLSENDEISTSNMLEDDLIDSPLIIAPKGKSDAKIDQGGELNDLNSDSLMEEILIEHDDENVSSDILLKEQSAAKEFSEPSSQIEATSDFSNDLESEISPDLDSLSDFDNAKEQDLSSDLDSLSELDNAKEQNLSSDLDSLSELDNAKEQNLSSDLDSLSDLDSDQTEDMSSDHESLSNLDQNHETNSSPALDSLSNLDEDQAADFSLEDTSISDPDNDQTTDISPTVESLTDLENNKESDITPASEPLKNLDGTQNASELNDDDDLLELELTSEVTEDLCQKDNLMATTQPQPQNLEAAALMNSIPESALEEQRTSMNLAADSDETPIVQLEDDESEADIFENKFNDEIAIVSQIPHDDDLASSERESALKNLEDSISDGLDKDLDASQNQAHTGRNGDSTVDNPAQVAHHPRVSKLDNRENPGKRKPKNFIMGQLTGCQRHEDGIIALNFSGGIHYKFDPLLLSDNETKNILINNLSLTLRREMDAIEITYAAHVITVELFPQNNEESAA